MSITSALVRWIDGFRRPVAQLGGDDRLQGGEHAGTQQRQALASELEKQAYLHSLLAATCADVMQRSVITASMDETIGGALELLKKHKIKLLPVTDSEHRLQGVVTRADLQPMDVCILPAEQAARDAAAAEKTRRNSPISTVMSTSVTTVRASARLTDIFPRS